MPSIADAVPPPAANATCNWHIRPPNGTYFRTIYSDVSRLDGPATLLARNGWAFVVLDANCVIIATACGVPPEWITDIPGTEAWAVIQAAFGAELGCSYTVDCEPCVKAFHMGRAAACAGNRALARANSILHDALDDTHVEAMM